MDLKQVEVFTAVAEAKSFSKAAGQLYLTQPTVSSHIKALEKEVGCILLNRTTKSVTLTPEGKTFLPYAKRMLELQSSALREIRPPDLQLIRLGASTIPSGYLLPQVLAEFRKAQPHIFFNITQSDSGGVEEMILDGTVDLGLTGQLAQDKNLVCKPFCTDTLVFATPATDEYLALQKTKPTLQRLLQEPIIIREQGSGTLKATDLFLQEHNVDIASLNVIARINDLESIKRMIAGGMGTSILSGFAASDMAARGQMILYSLKSKRARKFYIVRERNKTMTDAMKRFMKYLEKTTFALTV